MIFSKLILLGMMINTFYLHVLKQLIRTNFNYIVKVLEWGEDGIATDAETTALRASFKQEVAVWHKLDHPNVTKVNIILLHSFRQ